MDNWSDGLPPSTSFIPGCRSSVISSSEHFKIHINILSVFARSVVIHTKSLGVVQVAILSAKLPLLLFVYISAFRIIMNTDLHHCRMLCMYSQQPVCFGIGLTSPGQNPDVLKTFFTITVCPCKEWLESTYLYIHSSYFTSLLEGCGCCT